MTTKKMNISFNLRSQFKGSWKAVLIIAAISGFLILLGIGISRWIGTPLRAIYRDPVAALHSDFSIGLLSQVGGLMWISAASVFLFSGLALKGLGLLPREVEFLISCGILTLMLGLDDVFLFHEQVWHAITGLKENYLFAIYGLVIIGFGVRNFRTVLNTEILLVGLSAFFIALSFGIDMQEKNLGINFLVVEDIYKMIGIVSWLVYAWRTSLGKISVLSARSS